MDTSEGLEEKYRRVVAEKESALAFLQEARYLLEIKDEHIALLEQKAQLARDLQSQLDGSSIEAENLRLNLMKQEQKTKGVSVVKHELEEELINSINIEKDYLNLQDTHEHANNERNLLQQELKELIDLNKELLKELEKMGEIQAQSAILKEENHELKKRLRSG